MEISWECPLPAYRHILKDDERTFSGWLSDQDTGRPPTHPRRGSRRAATTARGGLQRAADRGSAGNIPNGTRGGCAAVLDGDYYGMQQWQQQQKSARDQDQEAVSRGRVWILALAGGPRWRKCCPCLWNRHVCSFCGHGVGRAVRTRNLAVIQIEMRAVRTGPGDGDRRRNFWWRWWNWSNGKKPDGDCSSEKSDTPFRIPASISLWVVES